METIGFSGEAFETLIAFIFAAPIAAKALMLDANPDPEEDIEDETRFIKIKKIDARPERAFCRRWLRAANYREENIERAIAGRPVDNCPRLTRAKRNLWRSLKDDHRQSVRRKNAWRETGDNAEAELAMQRARREIEAEIKFHATVTIDNVECERAIIAGDGEGMDGGETTVIERGGETEAAYTARAKAAPEGSLPEPRRRGVKWPEHYTILLGAGGVGFTKEGKVFGLTSRWLGYDNRRPLDGIEAIEFYLSWADWWPNCSYVMFSFNYDVTMLLKGLRQGHTKNWHYERVWEICKRQDLDTKTVRNNTIFIGNYAISYIKSKVLIIHKLDTEPGEDGKYPVLKRITIYDVFGFYQTSFVQVVSSLVGLGLATEEEVERMRKNKARRGDFKSKDWPLDRIKAYTQEELRKLSTAVTVLRKAAADDGIRLNRLDGAGNLSAGMMRKFWVMKHYKGLMKKYDAEEEQLIGYRTDFGGRIELIKQGFDDGGACNKYDEKSSYPDQCVIIPSMIGGFWVKREFMEFDWADVENSSVLSMFCIKWNLPERYIDAHGNMQVIPFYALPYRLESGGIRFFSRGYGWYRRDDVVYLKRWLETFASLGACVHVDGRPYRLSKGEANRLMVDPNARRQDYGVLLDEARLFYPGSDEWPFAFVPAEFEKRKLIEAENKRTGKYNIGEKVIKLGLNGLSGKVAQSIGGSETKPPGCYNVHYASAIRAGTRRSIGEAALQAPHDTVQFCTDAVFSKVPLILNEGKELGQWELEKVHDLLTVQSGIYSYVKRDAEKVEKLKKAFERGEERVTEEDVKAAQRGTIENKSGGLMASSVDLEAIENRMELEGIPDKERKMLAFREVLLTKVPAAWRQPVLNNEREINEASQSIELVLRTFMTAGQAVASRDRFDLIGRWAHVPKNMKVHTPGPKRRLLDVDDCDGDAEYAARLYSSVGKDAKRCHELVPTAPARPDLTKENPWAVMSRPHVPKWYEGEAQLDNDWAMEEDLESEDIAMGDQ